MERPGTAGRPRDGETLPGRLVLGLRIGDCGAVASARFRPQWRGWMLPAISERRRWSAGPETCSTWLSLNATDVSPPPHRMGFTIRTACAGLKGESHGPLVGLGSMARKSDSPAGREPRGGVNASEGSPAAIRGAEVWSDGGRWPWLCSYKTIAWATILKRVCIARCDRVRRSRVASANTIVASAAA